MLLVSMELQKGHEQVKKTFTVSHVHEKVSGAREKL